MAGSKKVENTTFKEYHEGIREYGNEPGAKSRCFEYAIKALDK